MKSTYKVTKVVDIYMKEIARLHGLLKEIILDRHPKFTSNFWTSLLNELRTYLNFSIVYYLERDGQTKRVSQFIEDMIRMPP